MACLHTDRFTPCATSPSVGPSQSYSQWRSGSRRHLTSSSDRARSDSSNCRKSGKHVVRRTVRDDMPSRRVFTFCGKMCSPALVARSSRRRRCGVQPANDSRRRRRQRRRQCRQCDTAQAIPASPSRAWLRQRGVGGIHSTPWGPRRQPDAVLDAIDKIGFVVDRARIGTRACCLSQISCFADLNVQCC
jgi:hypothetical protein